jgi:hypothetical protein
LGKLTKKISYIHIICGYYWYLNYKIKCTLFKYNYIAINDLIDDCSVKLDDLINTSIIFKNNIIDYLDTIKRKDKIKLIRKLKIPEINRIIHITYQYNKQKKKLKNEYKIKIK